MEKLNNLPRVQAVQLQKLLTNLLFGSLGLFFFFFVQGLCKSKIRAPIEWNSCKTLCRREGGPRPRFYTRFPKLGSFTLQRIFVWWRRLGCRVCSVQQDELGSGKAKYLLLPGFSSCSRAAPKPPQLWKPAVSSRREERVPLPVCSTREANIHFFRTFSPCCWGIIVF